MDILFIVQGEGRGHMTQAIALADMLRANGHRIVEVLTGHSEMRQVPGFFQEQIQAPVYTFASPNFLKTSDNKYFRICRSIIHNLQRRRWKAFFESIRFIAGRISEVRPDVVVNFYEMLGALAYWHYKIKVPVVCVAHQFMFIHPEFRFSRPLTLTHRLLRQYARICCLEATRCLALSYAQVPGDPRKNLFVVPPLLRHSILELHPGLQPYLLGYILNHGFSDEITCWHSQHPEIEVHVFWDKPDAPEVFTDSWNLTYHRLNYQLFTRMLGNCAAFFGTAGIEAVCEALYLGKPVLVVPAHGEQELNADYAAHLGVLNATTFNLDPLLEKIGYNGFSEESLYVATEDSNFTTGRYENKNLSAGNHSGFKEWADRAEEIIIDLVTGVVGYK